MTARQPRRERRRTAPAPTLPRPGATPARRGALSSAPVAGVREHHVTADYSYVRGDLLIVSGVTLVTLGFVVAMSFFL